MNYYQVDNEKNVTVITQDSYPLKHFSIFAESEKQALFFKELNDLVSKNEKTTFQNIKVGEYFATNTSQIILKVSENLVKYFPTKEQKAFTNENAFCVKISGEFAKSYFNK
ncbi:hypothetical protein NIES2100_04830 [Calothrix sp. NIES-2100]|uniref:hypothetical protein n=1 Tax=Calothrix sp. NIES-2100 TaxID=1954172 RepID=UPI000B5E29A8|nr:hypothetical protein NIES2100_04830 [Calothrix sp. NIES-2100]